MRSRATHRVSGSSGTWTQIIGLRQIRLTRVSFYLIKRNRVEEEDDYHSRYYAIDVQNGTRTVGEVQWLVIHTCAMCANATGLWLGGGGGRGHYYTTFEKKKKYYCNVLHNICIYAIFDTPCKCWNSGTIVFHKLMSIENCLTEYDARRKITRTEILSVKNDRARRLNLTKIINHFAGEKKLCRLCVIQISKKIALFSIRLFSNGITCLWFWYKYIYIKVGPIFFFCTHLRDKPVLTGGGVFFF